MFCASVSSGGLVGPNSLVMGVNINDVTIGHRLSIAHPKLANNTCQLFVVVVSIVCTTPCFVTGIDIEQWEEEYVPDDDEELPLVPSHTNVLNCTVKHPGFGFVAVSVSPEKPCIG